MSNEMEIGLNEGESAYLRIEDARLIAAAPDLLAACKLAIDAMDRYQKISPSADERLRAAIAKAEATS